MLYWFTIDYDTYRFINNDIFNDVYNTIYNYCVSNSFEFYSTDCYFKIYMNEEQFTYLKYIINYIETK